MSVWTGKQKEKNKKLATEREIYQEIDYVSTEGGGG